MQLCGDLSRVSITSPRLTLRSVAAADGDEAFTEVNAEIARFMTWNPVASRQEFGRIREAMYERMSAGTDLSLTVRLAATGEFLGMSALHAADGDLLETGIWIKQSAQRRGYGREAVAAVVAWAAQTFRPGGLLWPVVDENQPSRRLAESLGGEIVGSRRRQKPGDIERTVLLYRIPAPVGTTTGRRAPG